MDVRQAAEAVHVRRIGNGRSTRGKVERTIQQLISSGQLDEHGRLPTERDLAERLGVSRTTVRQVLDEMEHAGTVERRRGRTGGTFVSPGRVDIDFSYLAGIPAYLRAQGFQPGALVISARMIPADKTTARSLQIEAGALVHEVIRIRLADEIRISLEHVRIPVALAPDLLAQRLDDSIYDLLTERYGVVVVKAVERMVAVLTDRDRAELLGIDVGDPLMAIERVSYDDSDRPVEYSTDLFRGDRTRIIAWAHGASQPQQASVPATPAAPGEPG